MQEMEEERTVFPYNQHLCFICKHRPACSLRNFKAPITAHARQIFAVDETGSNIIMRDERILTATTKISTTNDGRIKKNYAGSNAIRA